MIEFQDAARVCFAVGVILVVLYCVVDIINDLVQMVAALARFLFILDHFPL